MAYTPVSHRATVTRLTPSARPRAACVSVRRARIRRTSAPVTPRTVAARYTAWQPRTSPGRELSLSCAIQGSGRSAWSEHRPPTAVHRASTKERGGRPGSLGTRITHADARVLDPTQRTPANGSSVRAIFAYTISGDGAAGRPPSRL